VLDPTRRFSDRVENYLRYRPSYPAAIIPLLESECGLTSESIIADVGSGTGFLTELFLRHENPVFGVEPNPEMRAAGERVLASYPRFSSVNAKAEGTTLPDQSMDFVVSGQAFHWFKRDETREEFVRILNPNGWLVLVWNGYRVETSQMMADYQNLVLRYGTDYDAVRREIITCEVEPFYAPGACKCARFEFQQIFDQEGLKGRLLSSSFAPQPGHQDYEPMLSGLREIFDANQKDGKVAFEYETELYYGQLDPRSIM
jgi:SAM-dependent methyltransferase